MDSTNTKKTLEHLLSLPKIEQKTEKWYEMRQNMITASDFAQALGEGKFGTQNQLIQKKCTKRENETAISKSNPFFKWGNMFEPVACDIYSKLHNNVKVHEFGLIRHPKYNFFGASPDGITNDGVMLEIKCPYKRKITGEIPTQYYYQIQGQLDVCDLNDCDYFECTFEFVDIDVFDTSNNVKGILRENNDGSYEYIALIMPIDKEKTLPISSHNNKYWILKQYNIVRVNRDKNFVNNKLMELEKVWEKILFYRENEEQFTIDILKKLQIDTETSAKISSYEKKKPKANNSLIDCDTYLFID